MKFSNKAKIVIHYGTNLEDQFTVNAEQTEIRWDENSFEIRGLFNLNKIKVEFKDGKDSKGNSRKD